MKRPWFKFGEFSEDYTFCLKAKEIGYKIKVDTSVIVKHVGTRVLIDEHFYEMYKPKLLQRQIEFDIR
jgi:hypothetical protein